MRNDFKYYQQLFIDMVERPDVVTASDLEDVSSTSVEEQGRLVIFALKEIDDCWEAMKSMKSTRIMRAIGADKITKESNELFMLLFDSLQENTGFSYNDFAYIANKGSLSILVHMLANGSCPVDFFVDYDYSRIDESYSDYLGSLGYSSFEDMLSELRWDRISDVAAFLKKREPELETLNDEMVLVVSGVAFSRP